MNPPEGKKKGLYKNLVSGGFSAAIAKIIVNPIERVEILRQVDNPEYRGLNIYKSFVKFYHTQGIHGFFKSCSAVIVRIIPFSAIEFYSFEYYKYTFNVEKDKKFSKMLLCGGLAGLNAITITFPLDVARTRLACNKDSSLVKSIVGLFKTDGYRGLYKGYSLVFIGSIPYVAVKQSVFDYLKNNLMIPQYRGILNFVFGAISGIIGTFLLYPTHRIKRVFQANNGNDMRIFKFMFETINNNGFFSLYKGMQVTLIKIIFYQGILFSANENFKIILGYEKK